MLRRGESDCSLSCSLRQSLLLAEGIQTRPGRVWEGSIGGPPDVLRCLNRHCDSPSTTEVIVILVALQVPWWAAMFAGPPPKEEVDFSDPKEMAAAPAFGAGPPGFRLQGSGFRV